MDVVRLPRRLGPGAPYPLGASYDGQGTNFAVFSAHAEKVELCLFDATGRTEVARYPLPECTNEIWHGYLPDLLPGTLYGYRAYGPYAPAAGHRFNPHKLLLDPYARQLAGTLRWSDVLYGYRYRSPRADLSFDRRDSATAMPKGVVSDATFNWHGDVAPRVPWEKTVIYETHLRGLTMQADWIPPAQRGTFAALADSRIIAYFQDLGVTTIELLPVHAYLQDRRLVEKGLGNYWGYNTLSFFAPEPRYLAGGELNEIRETIRQLHAAGLEVILDVVYNHSCEEGELGPTLSFRGLDNASYYRLREGAARFHVNETGCGNTLNLTHPRVIQLVLDSLRYWVEAFHIDGFRFDLSATLGRERHGFDTGAGFFDALMQDPVLSRVKLIAEPWDLGPDGYQVGRHPAGMAEWNDRFRDEVRGFWRGDGGLRGALATRLLGSADLFNHHRRRAWASVNFVTAHDGFTLQDLVSYSRKYNDANLEANRDGSDNNRSCNWGVEGPTEDPLVRRRRERVKRAMLMTLLFSVGTPMLLGGDEFGRTQGGNNNPYNQDNPTSWYDWDLARSPEGKALRDFVARAIALRQEYPTLHGSRFLRAGTKTVGGLPDTAWFDETGTEMTVERWHFHAGRLLALRRLADAEEAGGITSASLLLINGSASDREFVLPQPAMDWRVALDAAHPEAGLGGSGTVPSRVSLLVAAHSAILLVANNVKF